jgi:seryl-tRNA synthetase
VSGERGRQILIGAVIILAGVTAGEELYRRDIARRYQAAVESRRQLEAQFGEFLTSHERLKVELQEEQQRSKALSESLAQAQAELDESVAQLAQQTRTAQEFETRLTAMRQQMDQLQGELAAALQDRQKRPAASTAAVQLERVMVSSAGASALEGRVLSVHRDWNFIVLDLGWGEVKIGDTVSILRNSQVLAKARVERVQAEVSAATVLPEWETADIQVNDVASLL